MFMMIGMKPGSFDQTPPLYMAVSDKGGNITSEGNRHESQDHSITYFVIGVSFYNDLDLCIALEPSDC